MTLSERRVRVGGETVPYRVAGEGEPVVMMHGLGGSSRCWGGRYPRWLNGIGCTSSTCRGSARCGDFTGSSRAGHMPMLTRSEEFNQAILAFLGGALVGE